MKKFDEFVNEKKKIKGPNDISDTINSEFRDLQKDYKINITKILAKYQRELAKKYKGKTISGVEGYRDPQNSSYGTFREDEEVFVEDVKVETGEYGLEIIFVVKGKEYYLSVF